MKKIIALIIASSLLLSGFSLTGEVSDLRRTVEGYIEIVVRTIKSNFGVRDYSDYTELCDIPETENGYVPQGYCYSESLKLHFISYYHGDNASIISVVNAENGEKVKTLNIKKSNGKDFTGHAGGIAEDGEYLYIVDGKKIYRVDMDIILSVADGGAVVLNDKITTDVKCSYLNSDGKYIYAGEFYTFTTDGSYDTDKSHHMAISLLETTYARCNAYLISDIASAFNAESNETVTPATVFTTPNCVQGFARLPDGTVALSVSYGRNNNSSLRLYEDVTKGEPDFYVDYGGVSVPAYHLGKNAEKENLRQPPLLEGIDDMNGKTAGIFESCADKYSDSAFIVEKICVFE